MSYFIIDTWNGDGYSEMASLKQDASKALKLKRALRI